MCCGFSQMLVGLCSPQGGIRGLEVVASDKRFQHNTGQSAIVQCEPSEQWSFCIHRLSPRQCDTGSGTDGFRS
jgi:hypothetical protein